MQSYQLQAQLLVEECTSVTIVKNLNIKINLNCDDFYFIDKNIQNEVLQLEEQFSTTQPQFLELFSSGNYDDNSLFKTSDLALDMIQIQIFKESVILDNAEGDGLVSLFLNESTGTQ